MPPTLSVAPALVNEQREDHDQVLTLLRQAGPDGTKVEKELRRLLPLKTEAEYEPDDVAVARTVAAGST
jgi:hypothetical protein